MRAPPAMEAESGDEVTEKICEAVEDSPDASCPGSVLGFRVWGELRV